MKRTLALLLLLAVAAAAVLTGCHFVDVPDPAGTDAPTTDPAETGVPAAPKVPTYDFDLSEYLSVGQYLGIEVPVVSPEVTDVQMEAAVSYLLSQNAVSNPITDRPAKENDTLTIDYVGKINDVPFEGGTGSGKSITLTGNGGYIPGFADGLIGTAVGETVELNLTFPENYDNATYAGKDCVFTVTVTAITETILPEYTDAFVETVTEGAYTTVEAYNAYIRDALYTQNKELCDSDKERLIWAAVMDSVEVKKYPEQELNELYDSYMTQITTMLSSYDMKLEDYVKTYTVFETVAEFQDEIMSEAKDYLAEDMTMIYLVRENNITLTESEFNQGAAHYAQLYGYGTADAIVEAYGRDAVERNILFDKLFALLSDSAVETESTKTIEDLIAAAQ